MTPQNRTTALRMFGAFAASRKEGTSWLLLYQIDAFYVEVLYDRGDSTIDIIRSFKSTNMLKPYLEKINLEDLLIGI